MKPTKQRNKMEDCTVTTEIIDEVHHIYYTKDGVIIAECRRWIMGEYVIERWYRDDKFHRDDGPADMEYYGDQKIKEIWCCHGKLHRVDGPAKISYEDGQKIEEIWYCHGIMHREDGPASILYENGQKIEEIWYRDGKPCPIGQLAMVVYQNVDSEVDYYTGVTCTPNIDEFRDIVKGDAIHDTLRPLPIPIRQAIIPHYCYQ